MFLRVFFLEFLIKSFNTFQEITLVYLHSGTPDKDI